MLITLSCIGQEHEYFDLITEIKHSGIYDALRINNNYLYVTSLYGFEIYGLCPYICVKRNLVH